MDQRVLAILTHILGLVTSFVGPLAIFLIADETMPFAKSHARESLNFQITVIIASIISAILMIVVIGILGLIAVPILNLVFSIMASIAASENKDYRYPINIRFVN